MINRDPEAPYAEGDTVEEHGIADALPDAPLPELPGYEILRRLDSGGQGTVYSGYQANTGRRVAIKILRESSGDTQLKGERLRREARFLSRLHHPNIVTILDVGLANNQVFLVTDFIDGVPIDDHVNLDAAGVHAIVELVVKVCDAMAVAHASGVIHRDLKPQNIVVDENNQPYVLDFGLAQSLEENLPRLSETDAVVGTVEYLPPERIKGHHPDTRSDVYALGLILYECIADQLPFSGDNRAAMLHAIVYDEPMPLRVAAGGEKLNPNTAPSQLSRDLESVVMTAIAQEVDARYQSAADLAADLRRFLNDEPVLARSTSTGYMLRRILRRYRIHVTAACLVFVVLIASLVLTTAARKRTETMLLETNIAFDMSAEQTAGSVRRGTGDLANAIEDYKSSLALSATLESRPVRILIQEYNAHYKLAELYWSTGKSEQGIHHAEQAEALLPALIDHEEIRTQSISCKVLLGKVAYNEHRYHDAAELFLAAAEAFHMIALDPPNSFPYWASVANARRNAGRALLQQGSRQAEALSQLTTAHEIYCQLVGSSPNHFDFTIKLALTEGSIAMWHERSETAQGIREAERLYDAAMARLDELAAPADYRTLTREWLRGQRAALFPEEVD